MSGDLNVNERDEELNEYFKEFLKFKGYTNTLQCFKAEIRTK